MNTLYYHPLPRLKHRQGSGPSRGRLFWPVLLGSTAPFCLLLSLLYQALVVSGTSWPVGMEVPHALVARVATSLLGVLVGVTLTAQVRGYRVSAWVLLPALLLFAALWGR
jgi:hypothetical protein